MKKSLNGNYTYCSKPMLEAVLSKTTPVWPLSSHHPKYLIKMSMTYWALQRKYRWNHKQHSLIDFYIWTYKCWPTSTNWDSSALCRLWVQVEKTFKSDDQQGRMLRRNQRNLCNWYALMILRVCVRALKLKILFGKDKLEIK